MFALSRQWFDWAANLSPTVFVSRGSLGIFEPKAK
jgi:hypothetical protein